MDDALGPLAQLNDVAGLDAFESLALSRAQEIDDERCMELLAGALSSERELLEDRRAACVASIQALAQAAFAAASQSAPELAPGFEPTDIDVQLRLDERRPGWVWGQASMRPNSAFSISTRYCEDFHCPEGALLPRAAQAGAGVLLFAHPEFEYFSDSRFLPDDEQARLDAFSQALDAQGAHGRTLREALGDRGRVFEREDMARWLVERCATAAREGLLPERFEHSEMQLWGGFRGQPLLLSRWELLEPGASSFRSSAHVNVLEALPDQWGFDPGSTWALPSLDQGQEAVWTALCSHISRAARSGWGELPRWSTEGASERLGAALEAREIREEASRPDARSPKTRL